MARAPFLAYPALAAAALAAWLANGAPAAAADVHILSTAAMQPVLKEIADDFERLSGHRVRIRYAPLEVFTRTLPDETVDLVISSREFMSDLARQGRIRSDVQLTICKIGIAVVVPLAAAKPAVASVEDFKRTLLDARIVLYADPAGGGAVSVYIARVIEQLGISDRIRARTKFGPAGQIANMTVAEGNGAIGITQISEIVGKGGAAFAAPLPEELQSYMFVSAAFHRHAPESDAASAFLAFLASVKAVPVIKANGMAVD
jgi:molybdate transport system substrate-binding protein